MTCREPMLQASYALCRRVARRSGSSFYRAFALLSRPKRQAMDALYAFLRHTDDLADGPEPVARRIAALRIWRLEEALSAQTGQTPARCADYGLAASACGDTPRLLLPALIDTVQRFCIPPQYLHAVIDGVEMDLHPRCYNTFDELVGYCEKVAVAVGLASIHIWGFSGEEAKQPARQCGIAFQLTNILRDLKEDLAQGRLYLPLEDLQRCQYRLEDLAAGIADARFENLIALQVGRARQLYHEGSELIRWLVPESRRIFGMMVATYYRLLVEIQRHPKIVLAHRVALSPLTKLRIAARWFFLPPRRSDLP